MMDIEEVFFVHTHVSIRNHHLSVELSCKTCRWKPCENPHDLRDLPVAAELN